MALLVLLAILVSGRSICGWWHYQYFYLNLPPITIHQFITSATARVWCIVVLAFPISMRQHSMEEANCSIVSLTSSVDSTAKHMLTSSHDTVIHGWRKNGRNTINCYFCSTCNLMYAGVFIFIVFCYYIVVFYIKEGFTHRGLRLSPRTNSTTEKLHITWRNYLFI